MVLAYIASFIVGFYIFYLYYKDVIKVEEEINALKERIKIMTDVETLMLDSIKEIKSDVKTIKGELFHLGKEVVKLKTKATIFGSIAGSVSVFVFSIIKHYLP